MYKNNNCPFKAKREQYAVNPPSEHFPILQATWLLSGGNFCGGKKKLEKLLSQPGARPVWLAQIICRFVIVINVQLSTVSHFYLSLQSLLLGPEDTAPPSSLFTCFPHLCTSNTTMCLDVCLRLHPLWPFITIETNASRNNLSLDLLLFMPCYSC